MDRASGTAARNAALMGDDIVGKFLSKDTLHNQSDNSEDGERKLWRFAHDQEGFDNPRLLGSGRHGIVILVTIQGIAYALKIFKNWKQPGPVYSSYEQAIYTSPLAHESRAFARLRSIDEDGTWAVRCHGWIKLSDTQLETIMPTVNTRDLSRWAIVKEYCAESTNTSHIPQIYANFEIAKRARIWPRDVRVENYRGSRIVDLSSALTYPSPEWSEYWFKHFYKETVGGVFDWFESPPHPSLHPASQMTLAISIVVVISCASIWYRSRCHSQCWYHNCK